MPVFALNNGQLKPLVSRPFQYEKDLQKLLENNLMTVLDMHFLESQCRTSNGGRIDTLAVDANGSPAIIEYKRDRDGNVINQALFYLLWLRDQKPEFFEMLMLNKLGKNVADNIKLDWKNPRVVCVAESFNRYDMAVVEMVATRIELYRYALHDNHFRLEPVTVKDQQRCLSQISIGEEMYMSEIDLVKKQAGACRQARNLFDELRERVLSMDDQIVEKVSKQKVVFALSKHFAEVIIKKDMLQIDLRPIDYEDPRNMIERIGIGYTITMNRRVRIREISDLDYVFALIQQSYQNVR